MTFRKTFAISVVLVSGLAVAACSDDDDDEGTLTETETLTSAMEVPPPMGAANASGTFQYTMPLETRVMSYTLTVTNLTGPATAAHIHEAPVGMPGPVVLPLATPATGSATGTLTLTEDQLAKLRAGAFYVNVHTAMNMPGEVRVQLDGR